MDYKKGLKLIKLFLILSILLSIYLTYQHYKEGSSFCDLSEGLSCGVVNKSEWSELFGIPVAILGLLTFLGIYFLVHCLDKGIPLRFGGITISLKAIERVIIAVLAWSLIFALYLLVYVEYFKLKGIYCPACIVLDGFIAVLLVVAILTFACKKKVSINKIKSSRRKK
jgi:uncharacterized membrane protein